jgi:hypothetical protein
MSRRRHSIPPQRQHDRVMLDQALDLEAALSEKNFGNVLACLDVDDSEGLSACLPLSKIGQRHVASRLRVIKAGAGIAFDQLRHGSPFQRVSNEGGRQLRRKRPHYPN